MTPAATAEHKVIGQGTARGQRKNPVAGNAVKSATKATNAQEEEAQGKKVQSVVGHALTAATQTIWSIVAKCTLPAG
jgi:hypothetical protein